MYKRQAYRSPGNTSSSKLGLITALDRSQGIFEPAALLSTCNKHANTMTRLHLVSLLDSIKFLAIVRIPEITMSMPAHI